LYEKKRSKQLATRYWSSIYFSRSLVIWAISRFNKTIGCRIYGPGHRSCSK